MLMTLKIGVSSKKLADVKDNCLLIGFFENRLNLSNELKKFDNSNGNIISKAIKNKDFKAEYGEFKPLFVESNNLNCIALLGFGKEKEFSKSKYMEGFGNVSRQIRSLGFESFSVYFNSFTHEGPSFEAQFGKSVIALDLGLYQYLEYKTKDLDKVKKVRNIDIIVDKKYINSAHDVLKESLIYTEAVKKTRDLINTPPNVAIPITFNFNFNLEHASSTCITAQAPDLSSFIVVI